MFRIGPLYLFAAISALIIVFAKVGFIRNIPRSEFVNELFHWLSLGFLNLTPVNGYVDAPKVLAGVTWTLQYEWLFYLSLPALAFAACRPKFHLAFATGALVLSLVYLAIHPGTDPGILDRPACVPFFVIGMTCGSLVHDGMVTPTSNPLASVIAGALIFVVFFSFHTVYTFWPVVLLGGAFYLIAAGCSFFGLFTSRSARRLGGVSYGIYLLQGVVFAMAFRTDQIRDLALRSPLGHWLVVVICATLLVMIAALSHIVIERPGIKIGRLLSNAFEKRRTNTPSKPQTRDIAAG